MHLNQQDTDQNPPLFTEQGLNGLALSTICASHTNTSNQRTLQTFRRARERVGENGYRSGEGACPPRCSARPRRTPRAGSAPSSPQTSTRRRRTLKRRRRRMRRAASLAPSTGTASRRRRWRRPAAQRIGSGNPRTGRIRFEDGKERITGSGGGGRRSAGEVGDEKGLDEMRHATARGFSLLE